MCPLLFLCCIGLVVAVGVLICCVKQQADQIKENRSNTDSGDVNSNSTTGSTTGPNSTTTGSKSTTTGYTTTIVKSPILRRRRASINVTNADLPELLSINIERKNGESLDDGEFMLGVFQEWFPTEHATCGCAAKIVAKPAIVSEEHAFMSCWKSYENQLSESLKNDSDFMWKLIRHRGKAIEFVGDELIFESNSDSNSEEYITISSDYKKMVREAISTDVSGFHRVAPELRDDKEFMVEILSFTGRTDCGSDASSDKSKCKWVPNTNMTKVDGNGQDYDIAKILPNLHLYQEVFTNLSYTKARRFDFPDEYYNIASGLISSSTVSREDGSLMGEVLKNASEEEFILGNSDLMQLNELVWKAYVWESLGEDLKNDQGFLESCISSTAVDTTHTSNISNGTKSIASVNTASVAKTNGLDIIEVNPH